MSINYFYGVKNSVDEQDHAYPQETRIGGELTVEVPDLAQCMT
jgi:hypothetical protein